LKSKVERDKPVEILSGSIAEFSGEKVKKIAFQE
jgi:hypothetical protein